MMPHHPEMFWDHWSETSMRHGDHEAGTRARSASQFITPTLLQNKGLRYTADWHQVEIGFRIGGDLISVYISG